jgi:hypothetical protein
MIGTPRSMLNSEQGRMPRLAFTATVVAAIVLPLALAGCSSAQTPTQTPAPATASANPDAGLLTGAQLRTALAPASSFGTGFALDTSGSRDTGTTYVRQESTPAATLDCVRLGSTSWITIVGFSGVSFAQNDYIDKDTSDEAAQEIDVFRGSTSRSVLTEVGTIAASCPSFTDAQTSSKVSVAEHATADLGDDAYTITLTDPAWQNGTTLIAARVGNGVVSVLASGPGNGATVAKSLTQHIVSAVKAKD